MASRKEQKEQARAAREAAEREANRADARKRRLRLLGIALAAAVVVVVVAIVVSSSGGGDKGSGGLATGSKLSGIVSSVDGELSGIPQSGMTLGKASAPVTMTYFGDLQCPVCKDFTLQTFPDVVSQYVKTGKMKVLYRSFETASGGNPDQTSFQRQQVAAYAAGSQGKAWDYIELFYHQQGAEQTDYVTESYLSGLAKQVKGLDLAKWNADRKLAKHTQQLATDNTAAGVFGVNGTPTLVLKGPHGTQTASDFSLDAIKSTYDAVA